MAATARSAHDQPAGWLLVRNRSAGTDDQETIDLVAAELGGDCEVVATEGPEDVDEALRAAGDRDVVACGGDGSLHMLLERARALGLLGTLTFGLVPLGTGNDFAGSLGIPTDPVEAAEVLRSGVVHRFDLLVDDADRIVVNAVHIGVGVDAARRSAGMKDALGALAYPLGAMLAGVSAEGLVIEVEVDGARLGVAEPALMVVVSNGPTIGGGHAVLPGARPDDGLLDVAIVHAVAPAARAAFGVGLARGTHLDRDDVHFARGERVTISGPGLAHNADGDLDEPGDTHRTYTVDHGAWSLRISPESALLTGPGERSGS